MKRLNASVMMVAVVLALIAFVAPSSAYSLTTEDISCANGETTWIFTVSRDSGDKGISHWVVFWCNKDAVKEVWVNNDDLTKEYGKDRGWEYMTADHPDPNTGLQGIKIDYGFEDSAVSVKIVLDGEYCDQTSVNVEYAIKHGKDNGNKLHYGTVYGPVAGGACTDPIPEFSTIAIPIASILGLLFFFNHRKRREK
jgi:hypothetical protein